MNDALRMDLADCGSPETLLGAILKHHPDLPRRVPVEDIARSVGIIDFKELEVDGFEGGLTANPEKSAGFILTKAGLTRRRKRFTTAHELGHFLIPTHQGTQQCKSQDLRETRRDTPYRRQEAEANRFAAGLLMPKPMFQKDIQALGSADVTHAKELSDMYETSMEATVNRYAELTSDLCAFIFSKEGVVRYVRAHRDFPALGMRSGDRLPPSSITSRASCLGPTEWDEHTGTQWLQSEWGKKAPAVLEQCAVQANGYRVTLLFIDARAIEDEEEQDDLEGRWVANFGKRR
jgi:Zn-dependent peptidase ImmA (M78 family)